MSDFSMIKWYPWLNVTYRQIISCYKEKRGHHAMLLYSEPGNGEISLCYALSCWLMCWQPKGDKRCGVCYGCRLMTAGTHPNFYKLELEKRQQSLGINMIRVIFDKIYHRSYYGGVKLIWFLHANQLTEEAANALLKILEEPPEDTYFLISCTTSARILPTLKSRCLCWLLPTPNEEFGLHWLQQLGYDEQLSVYTALRLCANAPLAAEILLQPPRWKSRLSLCCKLQDALTSGNFLILLPVLNLDNDNEPLHWLLSLLTDALKWHYGALEFIVNCDMKFLVAKIADYCTTEILYIQCQQWLQFLRQCQEISGVNKELLITKYLINWEHDIAHIYNTI